jgi:hypothetical protein
VRPRGGHPHRQARNGDRRRLAPRDADLVALVDDERAPYAYVHIRGRARIDDHSDLLEWTTRIAERYVRADQPEAYGRRNAVPTALLVRVRPERVIAEFDVARW